MNKDELLALLSKPKKPSKYKNEKSAVGDISFDSKKEAKRWKELLLLEQGGYISGLQRQVKYVLIPKQEGERECAYVADFVYTEGSVVVVEDVKSAMTAKLPAYVIKRKLMLWVHKIKIRQV